MVADLFVSRSLRVVGSDRLPHLLQFIYLGVSDRSLVLVVVVFVVIIDNNGTEVLMYE